MNKDTALQAINNLHEAARNSVQAHDEEETRLGNGPINEVLLAVLAGGRGPAAAGEGQQPASNGKVTLIVDKEKLEVDRAVLTAIKRSFLGRVFEQGWDPLLPRDEQNRIFLDFDAEQFWQIVVFLKKFAAQENLPEHPEATLTKEEAKWGFAGLLELLGLGCLGTVEEARALGTKSAFLAKQEREKTEALERQRKEPPALRVLEVIKAQMALFEQADTAKEMVTVLEVMLEWDRVLAQRRSELEQEKKFLEHLAGTGVQEEGRREPPRIVSVYKDGRMFFQTFRSTLSLCPKLAEQLPPVRNQDREDRLDLDYDPSTFSWVIQYLRMKSLGLTAFQVPWLEVSEPQWAAVVALFEELGLVNEVLIGQSLAMSEAQGQTLLRELRTLGVKQLRLLYRGTRDSFTAERFHELCDNQGRTVTVCRSQQGHVFGGYSDVPWDLSGGYYKQSNAAFLFKLGHQHNVAFTRHNIVQNHEKAISCANGYGPIFGGNGDMQVHLDGTGTVGFYNFGKTYDRGPGNVSHLAESANCPLADIEVFAAS